MTRNPAMRAIFIDIDGSLEDVDRHADELSTLGVYEDSLERALRYNEPVELSMLERGRIRQDGLTVR